MRLFIAIFPPAEILDGWMKFKASAPTWAVRWTAQPALHLTLKFLGETKSELEPKINDVLKQITAATSPLTLELKSGGVFPPKGAPSIFWLGAQGDTAGVVELAAKVISGMKSLGYPVENRPYQPHLTVARANSDARLRGEDGRTFTAWVEKFSSRPFTIDRLFLVESRPGPTGSQYTVRSEFKFSI